MPQYALDIEDLKRMAQSEKEEIKRSMSQAYCLLVRANVTDLGTLSVLEEFAIRAINQACYITKYYQKCDMRYLIFCSTKQIKDNL